MRPDLSQRASFTCPECQTEGFTNLDATEESEEVEVTCDYCQQAVVIVPGGEDVWARRARALTTTSRLSTGRHSPRPPTNAY